MKQIIQNSLLKLIFISIIFVFLPAAKLFAQCGTTTYTIILSSNYYNETYCEIRNAAGTIVHSFGPDVTVSSYTANGTSPNNGPFTFWVSTDGVDNDNTPSWTIIASGGGGSISTGSANGGETLSVRDTFCFNSPLSSNADLSALTLSSGTLTPDFLRTTLSYTTNVSSSTNSITVTPTKFQANATIQVRINGGAYSTVSSGSASSSLSLNYGSNTINVRVTAQNGTTIKTYAVNVIRLHALDSLGLSQTTFPQGSYSLRLLSSAYTGPLVRINIDGDFYDVYPDSTSKNFSLSSNVSAAIANYNDAISPVTNDDLNSLISSGTDATIAIWYDQSANTGRNAIQANSSNQPEIIVSGDIVLDNLKPSIDFSGNRFLTITSNAFNSNLSGTVICNTSNANNSSGLANAWNNMNGILGAEQSGNVADFAYGIYNNKFTVGNGSVGSGNLSLAGNIVSNNASTKIHSWTRNNTSGLVSLFAANNETEGSSTLNTGTRSAVTNLAIGANQTSTSGQVFYTGKITELLLFTHVYSNAEIQTIENNQRNYYDIQSANASLSNITLNTGSLSPSFSSLITSYSSSIMFSNIVVTPTIADATASIEISTDGVNFDPIISGNPSDTIALNVGNNTIQLRVTAEDGVTIKTYSLQITRVLSNDANLINLVPNSLNLSPSFSNSILSYSCSVPHAFKSFKLKPTLSDNRATIQARINGGSYINLDNETLSNALLLNVGSNTIEAKITAENGITIRTFTITVTRNVAVTNYLTSSSSQVSLSSILTVGEAIGGYKMVGIPDGLGAFDNNDGTFTLLMNHELTNSQGITRTHGSNGAFVSKWVINKSDLTIESASDLIQNVKLWNKNTQSYDLYNSTNPMPTGFSRFCSADLPVKSALYNSSSTYGTSDKIFLNGEENGTEGRAFAHVVTGNHADTTVELPNLGKLSWENVVTCPSRGQKTIVAGLDDVTGGQVYFYLGTKMDTGSSVERAGLTNGKLYGLKVSGLSAELSGSIPAANTTFSLVDLGVVRDSSGAALEILSNVAGVTTFLRPEDGAWDPKNPGDFYFVTTNAFSSPSRLWKLRFANIRTPENGGTITAVLDGTEGPKMMDNISIDTLGHILIQEDVGNNAHNGKIWLYNIANDNVIQIANHDTTRFLGGGSNFVTQDEESSGIIDMSSILGKGKFLLVNQAHYSTTNELVEGGQLLSMSISNVPLNPLAIVQDSIEIGAVSSSTYVSINCSSVNNADYYKWTVPTGVNIVSGQGTTSLIVSFADAAKFSISTAKPKFIYCQAVNSISNDLSTIDSVRISKTLPSFLINSIISNPNNNLGKPLWSSTTSLGSNGKIVNVVSTVGLKVGNLIKISSGTGTIGTSNTVETIVNATQFTLKNNMQVNVSSGAVLKAYFVPQNTFTTYTSAAGASNLSTLVTVSSTTGLAEGMLLSLASGTGTLKTGTVVSKIIDATHFVISLVPTVNLSNSAVLVATPVLTNACPIDVISGVSTEIDYSIVATPIRNIGYHFVLPKGARISRIGDSTIIGYDTAKTTALKQVYTTSTNIGIVFDSLFTSGILSVRPYNNAGLGITHRLTIKTDKALVFKVTSTAAAIKNTTVRYKANVTNGSEVSSYRWNIPTTNVTALSGSISGNFITTNSDTLSLRFGNLFKYGSLKVEAMNNCGTGTAKTFALNGTLILTKSEQEMELEELIDNEKGSENEQIALYPNPNNGNFTLSIRSNEKEAIAEVSILNMMGQNVGEYALENKDGQIQSEISHDLPAGLYFVKVKIGSEINIVKIIVNR